MAVRYSLASQDGEDTSLHGLLNDKGQGKIDETSRTTGSTRFSSFVNLTNTIVGAGMLGLPYAYAQTGWYLGSFLLVFSGLVTVFSLHILSKTAIKVGFPTSFYAVTYASVPQLTFLVDFAVVISCFGVGISYLIVIGSLMPQVMEQLGVSGFMTNRLTWVGAGFLLVAPISTLKNMDALKYTSLFAIFCVIFLAFMIFAYAVSPSLDPCIDFDPTAPDAPEFCIGHKTDIVMTTGPLRVFSIFIFAYSCQTNIFGVINEIKTPSQFRIETVVLSSIACAAGLYATVAIAGYSTFGESVNSNILISYPKTALTSIARVLVCLLVAFSYPLQCFPARMSALTLWESLSPSPRALSTVTSTGQSTSTSRFRYAVFTFLFLVGTLGTALILDDLGVILALVGATGTTITSYILPGISYYVLFKDDGPSVTLYSTLALFLAGMVIIPVCVVFIFI